MRAQQTLFNTLLEDGFANPALPHRLTTRALNDAMQETLSDNWIGKKVRRGLARRTSVCTSTKRKVMDKHNAAMNRCIPSFKVIRSRVTVVTINGRTKLNNYYDDFLEVLKMLLRGAAFDEKWYLATYPDVADAVRTGAFKSGRHHFIEVGYFEGRRPGLFEVDEQWYCKTYPDVAESIDKGAIQSGQQHFNEHGYDEGRLPAEL
jgi:hypothetical protein